MSTSAGFGLLALLAAVGLCSCGTRLQGSDMKKILPPSSLQYHLKVDSASLPEGVTARERRVPGTDQLQTWIGNPTDIPFVIITTDLEGKVIRRQKIVGRQVFIESAPSGGTSDERQWQRLPGIEDVLIGLNFTPSAIVEGRQRPAGTDIDVPAPESFSIGATFGGEAVPIRGTIVYSLAANSRR